MRMTTDRSAWVPAGALALATGSYIGLIYLGTRRPRSFEMDRYDASDALFLTAVYMFVVMGAVIMAKRPGHRMGAIFLATGLLAMFSYGSFEYSVAAVFGSGDLPLGAEVTWFGTWGWIPMSGAISAVLLTYPTGRLLSRRWAAPLVLVGVAAVVAFAGSLGYWPHRGRLLLEVTTAEDLARLPGVPELSHILLGAANPMVLTAIFVSLVSVIVRFLRSRGDERQQMKGLFLAALVMVLGGVTDGVASSLLEPGYESTFDVLAPVGLLAVPIGTGFAILRYRLYEIDLVINRTLVYGALTAILAGCYVALVFGLQALLAPFTAESDLAIAGSTLAVAALFRPVRGRVQSFIDKRFYRRKFDAQRTLEEFSLHLRDEVDLHALSRRLEIVVQETMQPAHISLWLRGNA